MGACESTAAAAGATAAAAAGQAENGDREGNGTCGPTAESPGKHNLRDALNRRRCRGKELTDTSWADLGVNDDDGADNHGDAAHCVLEQLIEQHLSQTFVAGTEGTPQNVNEGDTCKDNDGNERDERTLLAPDAPWRSDLQHFVATIRSLYNPVPFHSYHHATHVTLSANKLMASLEVMGAVAAQDPPTEEVNFNGEVATAAPTFDTAERRRSFSESSIRSALSQLLGVGRAVPTSLERIAFVFTAIIHDVSHVGVSNAQLEMEHHPVHVTYSDPIHMRSYAECHSVEIGLDLLRKEDRYRSLWLALFGSSADSGLDDSSNRSENSYDQAFEDLVRHLVMCTDIASAERRKLGMERWQLSFGEGLSLTGDGASCDKTGDTVASLCSDEEGSVELVDSSRSHITFKSAEQELEEIDEELSLLRRRTMLEQLMQLSDVSHLTQSWQTFLKWNERLYFELIKAYHRTINESAEGSRPRTPPPHPSEGWYEGMSFAITLSFFVFIYYIYMKCKISIAFIGMLYC